MDATKIHWYVFEVPNGVDSTLGHGRAVTNRIAHQHDPFIASLIRKLQDEVRGERAARRCQLPQTNSRWSRTRAEAPPPLAMPPMEFEVPASDDDWPLLEDPWQHDSDFDDFD